MARRLIGIDLAWSERNGTGCVELVEHEGKLKLKQLDLLYSIDEIVKWIQPEVGDWVVAIDAPLVVCNKTRRRKAEKQVGERWGKFHAFAHSTNWDILDRYGSGYHQGGKLLGRLAGCGGKLVEHPADVGSGRLVFETYPHPAMVELFWLDRIIKYKKGRVTKQRAGQQQLVEAIRRCFCGKDADPQLEPNAKLRKLLSEPRPDLKGKELKHREDRLDAVVCAYVAAWVAAGKPWSGLGDVGQGVIVVPDRGRWKAVDGQEALALSESSD